MRFFRRIRYLPHRDELAEEMRVHQEMRREDGLGEAGFGNDLLLRERSREAWGWTWLDRTAQDLRIALRQMRRAPGFAALAIVILALGIGANTALFSVIDAALLAPLPYPHPGRIVVLYEPGETAFSTGNGFQIRLTDEFGKAHAFAAESLYMPGHANVTLAGASQAVAAAEVGHNFFAVMGIAPQGRGFTAAEQVPGRNDEVVLSAALAQKMGGARRSLGRQIRVNGKTCTVVGVMPRGLAFPNQAQLWMPLPLPWSVKSSNMLQNFISTASIARLRPGATVAEARRELIALAARPPSNLASAEAQVQVAPLKEELVSETAPMLWMLLGAVGLVLLIACADMANLQLTRAVARQHEMAVRAALGASRPRLLRQNLTESLLLASLGGAGGLLLAWLALPALGTLLPASVPLVAPLALDGRVLVFTAAAAVFCGIVFGLFPALHANAPSLRQAVEASGGSPERGWLRHTRAGLAVAEVALALMLAAGAGLLLLSFARLAAVSAGFQAEHLMTARLSLGDRQHKVKSWWPFYATVLPRIATLPGVDGAAVTDVLPMAMRGYIGGPLRAQAPEAGTPATVNANVTNVSPGYFRVLGLRLIAGRGFDARDTADSAKVAVVSKALAQKLWPRRNPLGQRISSGPTYPTSAWLTVVGVVGDVHAQLYLPPKPAMYVPLAQSPSMGVYLLVRTIGPTAGLAQAIRKSVAAVDPNQPLSDFATERQRIDSSIAAPRFRTLLLSLFAALALLLAAAGIFGVMAYWAARRTAEIGIRMALGAEPRAVVRLVAGQGMRLVGLGIALGLAGALALGRVLSHFLFHVGSHDPATLAAAAVLMALIGAAACYVPARRAARLDPLTALRRE